MNYFEDEYIVDIVGKLVPQLPDGELRIRFPGGVILPARKYPSPLLTSIRHYDKWLPLHLAAEKVNPELVISVEIVVTDSRKRLRYRVDTTDNRGRIYSIQVIPP